MKLISTIIILLCFVINSKGQTYIIKGSVTDTLNMAPLYRASITLLRATDSGVEAHTRTRPDGKFEISVAKAGKYIIRISFVSFADYVDVLNVSNPVTDVGEVPMISREHLLTEFVITQQIAAIKIKGDTTEYMADSFKVKEGANVEDLLKKLPGIQVDKNGKITAQGETVQKVLVDGEEFFSDDPKVVTQGLQSAVVSKVQVYDKKSDQAEFTGIDDGQKTKTINLELKEDKKKGFFGKADVGGAPDGYFQNQGMINAFKGKRQLSVFGIFSNTDKVGLGWAENDKYAGGAGIIESSDANNFNMIGGSYDEFGGWNGSYEGQGLPQVATGGIHFADKWNEDKSHLSASYRYADQQVQISGDNTTQSSLAGDTIRINKEHKDQASKVERNGFNGFYEWKIDSTSSLRLVADANMKHSNVSTQYHTRTYDMAPEAGLPTINDRTLTGNTKTESINTDLLYRKKFAKKGRTISVDVKENYNDTKGFGYLISSIATPDPAGNIHIIKTDQEKTDSAYTLSFATKVTYTEPLSKTIFLEVDYGLSINNSTSKKYSYNKPVGSDKYDIPSDSFSSNYKYNILSHQAGLNFKFVYKKYNFAFGSDVSTSRYLQTDLLQSEVINRDSSFTHSYPNIYPKASFTYKFGKQTSLRLNYEGRSKQPTISEIQPLSQNTDPLNITVGNPNLKQSFTNSLRMNFNDYKVLSGQYFYIGLSATADANAISTAQTINGPVSTTRYINVDGNYNDSWWMGYSLKWKKADINVGFSVMGDQSHINNIINNLKNTSDNASYTFGPNFSKEKEDKYEMSVEPHLIYNDNRSAISTYNAKYWAFNTDFNASIKLPKKFDIGTTGNIMLREKTIIFPDNNQVIRWNAYVSKKFFKKGQLELKLTLYDILNQNTGYSRTARGNTISQESYNTIRRYGMLNVVWNFTYTPGAIKAADDDVKK